MDSLILDGLWEYEAEDGRRGTMPVPSNWHRHGLADFAGTVRFSREFEAPPLGPGRRCWLRFEGVDYEARVTLNGVEVGFHRGYFAPFECEVTDVLRERGNRLEVAVCSPKDPPGAWPHEKVVIKGVLNHHDCRPGSWDPERGQDGNTGGIWNSVRLLTDDGVRIHRLRAAPQLLPDGRARVACSWEVSAASLRSVLWELVIVDEAGETAAKAEGRAFVSATPRWIEAVVEVENPRLWWTWDFGTPHRYQALLRLRGERGGADEQGVSFGIRQLRIDEDRVWWLNGRRFYPRGTNIIPTQWLAEYTPELIAEDIRLLREANVNAVRVHAHVNRPELYEALDRAGILCWQDFALQWSYAETPEVVSECRRQIQEMVDLLYNHPSIVVWCCHNEPSRNRHTLDPLLAAAVREADGTRHVEEASDFRDHVYPGWYYGHWREFAELPGAPFVNEFGAQALMNVESMREALGEAAWPPDWARWAYHDFQYRETFFIAGIRMGETLEEFVRNSQEYQARLLKFAIEQYRLRRFAPRKGSTGLFQFMFMDCWPSITWSVVDAYRRPKLGYEALKLGYQPVLPVILPRFGGDVAAAGSTARFELRVVNDLPERLEDLVWEWEVVPAEGGPPLVRAEGPASVPADSVTRPAPALRWSIPADAAEGPYEANVRLTRRGTLLAWNWYRFEVRQLPAGTVFDVAFD